MDDILRRDLDGEWIQRWRVAREAVAAASTWILTLPILATVMRWHRKTATWIQNILGPISGLVWGRIGWIGVRRYGFSGKDAFWAGGLAGALAPTLELTLRLLGWPPGRRLQSDLGAGRPPLIAYPLVWFWGFVFGGALAALGAAVARIGRE